MMKELVEFLACALVEDPSSVRVEQEERNGMITYKLRVAEEDMGTVIGRQGKVAKAIRHIVKAAAIKSGKRVMIDIG